MRKITLLLAIMFITLIANAVTKSYAVTDLATLQADLLAGNADIYVLTTPGGNYQFTSSVAGGIALTKSTTIQAAANLYAKPIISINNSQTGTSSSTGIFSSTSAISLTLQDLDVNGFNANTTSGVVQPALFYSGVANNNITITRCYVHNFLNAQGVGLLYFSTGTVASTTQAITFQNSTFNACGGRVIYLNTSTNPNKTNISLTNCTFSNSGALINARGCLIYNGIANTGSTTVDHCTFYNIQALEGKLIRQTGTTTNGSLNVNNSIFMSVGTTGGTGLATYTATALNNCYLAGMTSAPTGIATQTTLPTFLNPLILDFTLTNKSLFTASDASLGIGDMSYYPVSSALTAPSKPNDASSIGIVNFTAGWTPVSAASGYTIYVYNQTGTQLITALTVSGQATSSAVVSGLAGNTVYYYTVKALADGTVNSNSVESSVSNTFTTNSPVVLTAPSVGSATAIGGQGFIANWTPVSNAAGYTINVYNSTPALVKSVSLTGQAISSGLVSGLTVSTAYTYKVLANGDGLNFTNSSESSASTTFSTITLSTTAPTVGTATAIGAQDFTANWTIMPYMVSYTVNVYDGSSTLVKSITTPTIFGNSFNYIGITGLTLGGAYSYTVVANGDGVYAATASTPSASSGQFTLLSSYPAVLNQNFSDGTWGLVSNVSPALGTYPIFSANGWDLTHAQIKTNASIGPKGEVHTNVLMLDKTTNSGVLTIPTIASVAEIEIHSAATAGRQYLIQSSIDNGTNWVAVGPGNLNGGVGSATAGTYYNNSNSLEQIDIIPTGGLTNAKFKITDPSSGAFTFYQIITRPTTSASLTALAAPTGTLSATNTSSTGFTANWPNVVANATGYKVNVYSNKLKTLITTATVSNPSALSLAVTGLQPDSTYTYGVVGLGDNTTYSDGLILMATTSVVTNLAAPIIGSVTTIVNNGFTAVWSPVNNAVSYNVLVYDGTTLLQTNNASGQATSSLNITGLAGSGTYTYTVIAKGDGVAHFDSAPSVASGSISTLTTNLNNVNKNSFITTSGKTIISSEIGKLEVYNLLGAKILQAQIVTQMNTNLASGIYLVKLTTANGQVINAKVQIK